MKNIAFSDIRVRGDLAVRSGLNFARLEGDWYRPDEVFKADSHGWPGDWEGRVALALTLLEQSTHRTSAYLEEILRLIPENLNECGYFGPVLPPKQFDEQHFGGHSWMLRALAEYYIYKGKPETLALLRRMVNGFLMPAKGYFAQYPIVPVSRFDEQSVWILSKLQTKTLHHAETSDAGCVFIMIDGASAVYEVDPRPELREVIDEMITRFMEMDLEKLHIQTHATLSATRGILRMYELTGEARYLDMAVARYELYRGAAWTETYGNYNWFGAPRWTEPCAIVDSYMAAITLWKHLRNPEYLQDAHLIYYNALSHSHRINGSLGSDRCSGAQGIEDALFLAPINYETYWCCTMRGGEGFSRAIEYNYFIDGNDVYVPTYHPNEATLRLEAGELCVTMDTRYPYENEAQITVTASTLGLPATIRLFVPTWARDASVTLNGKPLSIVIEQGFACVCGLFKPGDVIALKARTQVRMEEGFAHSVPGVHKFMFGPMLLGCKAGVADNSLEGNRFENYAESRYKAAGAVSIPKGAVIEWAGDNAFTVQGTDIVLNSLCSVRDMTKEDTMHQVLFMD
ncbi:MAG: glycoside hydrolase family 127 protein [Clostridia bacterium]|nr:glycoside hydrolase family 127 protein [Clostridia bacterium]